MIFTQEKLKVEERLPAARAFIREHKLNEMIAGDLDDIGIIVMGGLTNSVLRALERMGLADIFGASRVSLLVLNVVYPLVPEEIREFCLAKRAVLVVEEGSPDYIEQAVNVELRRADIQTKVLGKGPLPQTGEYTSDVLLEGLASFLQATRPAGIDADTVAEKARGLIAHKAKAAAALGPLPPRPPAFCTGCPERPVFSAIKLMQRELGPTHISADIGCHSFATFAPFSLGNSILGYGMSLASAAAVGPNMDRRSIAIMGDGGFWHNGLITGVASNLFNKGDGVLIVMQNGYASATGQQYIPSSTTSRDGPTPGVDIEQTLRAMGVKWLRTVRTYSVARNGQDAEGGDAHRRARPEGDHRRRRMPARAPAPRARRGRRQARARPARHPRALRRRRRDLHRRPFLHSFVGLPVADGEALDRSAAHRSGGDRDRILRRLRAVRRGRACRRAVPVVLPRRDRAQRHLARPRACIACARRSSAGSAAMAARLAA